MLFPFQHHVLAEDQLISPAVVMKEVDVNMPIEIYDGQAPRIPSPTS
jgi:hypothetical protein